MRGLVLLLLRQKRTGSLFVLFVYVKGMIVNGQFFNIAERFGFRVALCDSEPKSRGWFNATSPRLMTANDHSFWLNKFGKITLHHFP